MNARRSLRGLLAAAMSASPWTALAEEPPPHPSPPPLRAFYDYPFGPATTSERALSVEEAIAAALAQASSYRQAQIEQKIADEDLRQTRAALLPQLTAPVSYFGTTPSSLAETRVPSFAPSIGINETSALMTASGALDLSGSLRAARGHAREVLVAARAGVEAARRELALATVDAYYGLALARQKRRLGDETLAIAEGFAEITSEQAAAGEAGEAELHRARAEALKRRDELEQARAAESAAADALRALTGIDASVHVAVARLGPELPPLADFAQYTEAVVDSRPQLRQIDALSRAATAEERAARGERRPQVAYAFSVGFDAVDLGQLRRYTGGAAIVSLRVPVFDFGGSRSREAQARLRREGLEAGRESTARALRQEFYTARAAAFSAVQRRQYARERAEVSEKSLKVLTNRYRRRKATMTEVVDAQSAYAEARVAYYQAISDLSTARVRLEVDPVRATYTTVPAPTAGAQVSEECGLGLARAPQLVGLGLGMTVDEVRRQFPGLEDQSPKKSGLLNLKLEADDLAGLPSDEPAFAPSKVALRFFEGRLYYFRVSYYAVAWDSLGRFMTRVGERLALPGGWKAFYDWRLKTLRDAEDLSDMALECEGFRVRAGLGIEGVEGAQRPHVKVEDTAVLKRIRTREAEEARREAEEQTSAPEGR